MGATTSSTRQRRASSDVTQGRKRAQLRSASGTFLKTDGHLLTPWYPATPVTSRNSSPRPSHRHSFNKIPENDDINDTTCTPEDGRQQRINSRSFLGRLIHRKRTGTSSSFGSTSTIEAVDTEICIEVPQDRTPPKILENGAELDSSKETEKVSKDETDKVYHDNKDGDDNVFLDVEPRPRLASAESSCSEYETHADGDNQLPKKQRSTTLVYKPPVEEKAVQTDQVNYTYANNRSKPCEYCRHRCLCRIESYDSNSSTQSLQLNAEEKSKRRRKRWSPLIKKRQLLLKQAVTNQTPLRVGHYEHGYQSTPIRQSPLGMLTQITDSISQSQPPSPKKWHIQYRQNRRRRTFSEDRVNQMNYAVAPQCGNTNSDPSLCSQKSTFPQADENRQYDHMRHARLYNLRLQKAKMPLVKSSSYSPTAPLRRQTWSEKSRAGGPPCEGPKKAKGFLYMLRNLRSTCSETDISMEHRPSVDSNGYVDPFYITKHFNRHNLKRLSLSHPNLNTGFKGSTNTSPSTSSLRGRVSAAVGRLERALTGRASFCRTYSLESQSTSNGWNSDFPGSQTDSDAAVQSYNKHYRRDSNNENGYMTFDPDLNPPMPRPRRLLSSSCSSAPSSPGFQEGFSLGFDDVIGNTGREEEGIYESLDNYSPKRRASTLKSLPSSDGEAPPEIPPRPPAHRQRHRQRMLRRQMPLPPIPITHSTTNLAGGAKAPITTTSSTSNINTALHSFYKTTGCRHNFISGQSSSCSTLPSCRMDSSEEDSVFEAQVVNTPVGKIRKGRTIIDSGLRKLQTNYNHDNSADISMSGKQIQSHHAM